MNYNLWRRLQFFKRPAIALTTFHSTIISYTILLSLSCMIRALVFLVGMPFVARGGGNNFHALRKRGKFFPLRLSGATDHNKSLDIFRVEVQHVCNCITKGPRLLTGWSRICPDLVYRVAEGDARAVHGSSDSRHNSSPDAGENFCVDVEQSKC
jgi:hypothetical protein